MRVVKYNSWLLVLLLSLFFVLAVPIACATEEPDEPEFAPSVLTLTEEGDLDPELLPEVIILTEGEDTEPEFAPRQLTDSNDLDTEIS